MKRLAPLFLAGVVGLAACSDDPTRSADAGAPSLSGAAAVDGISRGQLSVPSVRLSDQYFTDIAARAINPGDYVCSSASPISDWLNADLGRTLTDATERALFFELYNRSADLIPTYEALYFQTPETPQYYGYNGEYTDVMLKTEKDAKRFWDIPSADIQMVAMHGNVLMDVERTARTYQLLGLNAATAMSWAVAIRDALVQSQTMNGGDYAFFTFNAFAYSNPGGPIPDKIVMGDGILAGYGELGFGDVAPQAIFAHEFAHQIQFENDYWMTTGTRPEQSRYAELMADAMSAYYLTHKRGAAMNQKRVEMFLQVFFQIGDCSFTSNQHHGTPNQRMAAAQWGFELAAQAQKQGHILTAEQVHALFVEAYPGLVAPDAP